MAAEQPHQADQRPRHPRGNVDNLHWAVERLECEGRHLVPGQDRGATDVDRRLVSLDGTDARRGQVRSVDRAAIEDYGIPGIVLMENASRALARTALDMLDGRPGRQVLIICGSGNNGGDGWALARHLHNAQMEVVVASLGEPRSPDDAGANCAICRKMGIHEIGPDRLDDYRHAELIVDAIFGTGLDREVHGRAAEIIEWINATGRPVLAVDVPSGLDCDRGRPLGVCVKATRTVSFVGYKPGFTEMSAQPFVGEIEVGEIGVPIELVQRLGTPLPPGPSPSHRRGGTSE